jgi:hypothetical protein
MELLMENKSAQKNHNTERVVMRKYVLGQEIYLI